MWQRKNQIYQLKASEPQRTRSIGRIARFIFLNIPESTDEELRDAARVGRPKSATSKQLIAIRLDPSLISRLKKIAKSQDVPLKR